MRIHDTALPGIRIIDLNVHHDGRGWFLETWQSERYQSALGLCQPFVQHNQSFSRRNVLRGMHYQCRQGQGKLVRVVQGRVWDVVVDVRRDSPTLGRWVGVELSGIDGCARPGAHRQIWIPPGFAHGFQVLSEHAIVEYLCTEFYRPDDEVCLRWDDPQVGIDWPHRSPCLSPRDACGRSLGELQEASLLAMVGSVSTAGPGPVTGTLEAP